MVKVAGQAVTRRAGRQIFLARRTDIQKAVEEGELLKDMFVRLWPTDPPFSYTQFTRHVKRHISPPTAGAERKNVSGEAAPRLTPHGISAAAAGPPPVVEYEPNKIDLSKYS